MTTQPPPTDPNGESLSGRRRVLLGAGATLGLSLVGAAARAASPAGTGGKKTSEQKEEDIGPGEDLMREHGVLRRVLLIYGDVGRRLETAAAFDIGTIQKSAKLVRTFVEDYHERQEEKMVFPRFERAHKLEDLVHILRLQHQAGRTVTDRISALATTAGLKDPRQRGQLRGELLAFIRMYEPHACREDTVLFPALHDLVSPSEYDALGEDFERREHQTFGADGFEHAVAEVETIERTLGIAELAQFTPKG